MATLPRSAVKSVSTFSVELTVTTDTMSALLIFSLTYFCAESTARCTSSGCIELTSNSSVISRRPAIDSEVGASAAAAAAGAAAAAAGRSGLLLQLGLDAGQQVGGLDRSPAPCP